MRRQRLKLCSDGAIEVVEDVEAQGSDKTLIVMNENVYLNGVLPLLTECYSNFQHTKEVEQSNMTCYSTCCTLSKSMNLERKCEIQTSRILY